MNVADMHDMGEAIKLLMGHPPEDSVPAVITGAAIERTNFKSCKLHGGCGAATGGPSAQTVDVKLTHSATSGGSYVDLPDAAITQLVADDTEDSVNVDLGGALNYIKVVTTITLTGGTTPTIPVNTAIALGGSTVRPAV